MKLSQRQPICITRLKKKQSLYSGSTALDSRTPTFKIDLISKKNTSASLNSQESQNKENSKPKSSLALKKFKQNLCWERDSSENEVIASENMKELKERNHILQKETSQLLECNQKLAIILNDERKEKKHLKERIDRLENSIKSLSRDYESVDCRKPISIKINSEEKSLKNSTLNDFFPKKKEVDLLGSQRDNYQSRNSLRSSFDGSFEEQSNAYSKMKEYKNQLESERIKRTNLEKELCICKQNMRIQFRTEIESLQKNIVSLKDTIVRKDREIKEKESLIERHILKK